MKPVKLKPGDVIVADRFLYQHYGIYSGNDRVIHYAAENGDFGSDVRVRETSLEQFAKGWKYRVLKPNDNHCKEKRFSKEDTICRARSRKGEKAYNLLFNNCEHFALWCETGKNKSEQVEKAVCTIALLGTVIITGHFVKNLIEES